MILCETSLMIRVSAEHASGYLVEFTKKNTCYKVEPIVKNGAINGLENKVTLVIITLYL